MRISTIILPYLKSQRNTLEKKMSGVTVTGVSDMHWKHFLKREKVPILLPALPLVLQL